MRIKNKFKFIKSMIIIIFLLVALCVIKSNTQETEYIDYTITKGETLWSIAEEYTPSSKDIRQTIFEIKQLNDMTNSNIYENKVIKIKIEQ